MTESQQVLHGGAMWVGPLFLAGYLLLYWYLDNAPLTRRGRRRAEARGAVAAAERARRLAELEAAASDRRATADPTADPTMDPGDPA